MSFLSHLLHTLAPIALPILGTLAAPGIGTALGIGATTAGAIGGGLGGLAGGALNGGGLSGVLEGGALGAAGGFLGNGGASELLGGTGIGDALGLTAPGSTAVGSGLSSEFANGVGGAGATDPFSAAARSAISDTATSAVPASTALSGYLPGAGASVAGGGTSGGFLNLDDLAGTPTAGISNQFQTAATPSSITSYGDSLTPGSAPTGGSSVQPNTSSFLNSLLRSTVPYALGQNPSAGLSGVAGAANTAAGNFQPFLASGTAAQTQIANAQGLDGADAATAAQGAFRNSPGYQFAQQQGIDALDASAAAHGGLLSGNQQRAVQTFGSGLADQTYQQYMNNLQNTANTGMAAAGNVGNLGMDAATANALARSQNSNRNNQFLGSIANLLFPANGNAAFSF